MAVFDHLLAFLARRREEAYLVGGSVRDLLLDRGRYDIDVAVVGDAATLARAFADENGCSFYVMDEAHDVARVICEGDGARYVVDFAAVRGEGIEQDLATRDFSINAMAADISGGAWDPAALIDPFNGRADLEARTIRALADSVLENDPVRLLRAVRFEAQLGFTLQEKTERLVRRDAARLARASPERVRDEMVKILGDALPAKSLRRLDELGLLEVILPEVTALKGVTQSAPHVYDVFEHTLRAVGVLADMQRGRYADVVEGTFAGHLAEHFSVSVSADHGRALLLRLALLLHDIGKAATRSEAEGRVHFIGHEEVGAALAENALRRLRFSNEEIDLLTTIVRHHLRPILLAAEPSISDRAIYRYFRATGTAGVDVAVHAVSDQRTTYGEGAWVEADAALQTVVARLLDRYFHAHTEIVAPTPLLSGHDVMKELRLAAGPRVGEVLEAVREAQAVGEVQTREQALAFVRKFDRGNGTF